MSKSHHVSSCTRCPATNRRSAATNTGQLNHRPLVQRTAAFAASCALVAGTLSLTACGGTHGSPTPGTTTVTTPTTNNAVASSPTTSAQAATEQQEPKADWANPSPSPDTGPATKDYEQIKAEINRQMDEQREQIATALSVDNDVLVTRGAWDLDHEFKKCNREVLGITRNLADVGINSKELARYFLRNLSVEESSLDHNTATRTKTTRHGSVSCE